MLVNTLSKAMQNLGGLEGRLGEKFDARITKLNMDIDEKADERANDTVSACVSTYCAFRKSRGSSASGSPERTALADAERGAWLVAQRGAWATNALADATTKQAKIGCILVQLRLHATARGLLARPAGTFPAGGGHTTPRGGQHHDVSFLGLYTR